MNLWARRRRFALWACAAALFTAVSARCFHPVHRANVGLDPSWALGIAEAADRHLAFGRDVVVTFGPLGYLIDSVSLPSQIGQRLAFQAAFAMLIGALGSWHFLVARTALQKILFALVLLMATEFMQAGDELLILALVLLWTSPAFRGTVVAPGWALALGIFSGFLSLTKFTVGIDSLAGGLVLLGAKAFTSRSDAGARNGNLKAIAIFTSAFAALSLALPASASYGGAIASLLCAICVATALAYSISDSVASRRAFLFGALCALVLCMAPSALSYAITSVDISAGYSAAMSTAGPEWQLSIAFALLALCALLLFGNRTELTAPVALSLGVAVFLSFKHGFVRQDAHVMDFFDQCIVIAMVAISVARGSRLLSTACLAAAIALLSAQKTLALLAPALPPVIASLDPRFLANDYARAIAPEPDVDELRSMFDSALADDDVAPDVATRLRSGTVDSLPWETNIVFANYLAWRPEPVFQSYQTDAPLLDEMNAESLNRRGADRILFAWQAIDGRYGLWDSPAALREIVCRYRLDRDFAQPSSTTGALEFLVLKRGPERCETGKTQTREVAWGQPFAVPSTAGALTFAAIDIHYSVIGKLLDELYRVPPIYAQVAASDGRVMSARFVGEVAGDGLLVNPLPSSLVEFGALLSGAAGGGSRTLTLETEAPWYFEPNPKVTFETVGYR